MTYIFHSKDVSVFAPEGAEPDPKALEQLTNCLLHPSAVAGALMADHHLGYSLPIGGVIKYDGAISPSGVGFDIACGNMAVATDIRADDDRVDWWGPSDPGDYSKPSVGQSVMHEIQKKVEFGVGKQTAVAVEHELFDNPVWHEIDRQFGTGLKDKARAQLGTVGSGNHYVDLLVDELGYIWVANHFGSRGLGHTLANGFMAAAEGLKFTERVRETEESVVIPSDTDLGAFYIWAMELAGQYAYAGREYVIAEVLKIIGNPNVTASVHNHHNFAWREDGLWVVRKGATPLTHEPAFIGGSMGDISVIVRGRWWDDPLRRLPPTIEDIGALGSAPHGAGRTMSRTAAAGKMRKMWSCSNRDCDFQVRVDPSPPSNQSVMICPSCGGKKFKKVRARDKSTAGIDWEAARAALTARGIIVLGAGADESPGVYKSLESVLEAHSNIEVLEILEPIGVVMASSDTYDPYRD